MYFGSLVVIFGGSMKRKGFLSLLLVALLLFCSCAGNLPEPGDTDTRSEPVSGRESETSTEPEDGTVRTVSLVKNKKACYRIVVPKDCSSQLTVAAEKLRDKLKDLTGVLFALWDDERAAGGSSAIGEIVVGNCDRAAMRDRLSALTYRDYAVNVTDGEILIAGYEDAKVVDAVYSFLSRLDETTVAKDGDAVTMSWSGDYEKRFKSYKFDSLSIGGVSLSEYRIVYPAGELEAYYLECAKTLQNSVGRRCGAYLPICADTETESAREILLGWADRAETDAYRNGTSAPQTMECALTVRNGKLLITCGNVFSLSGAVSLFDQYLASATSGALDDLNRERVSLRNGSIPSVNGDYRVMSYNVMHHASGWATDELLALPFVTRAANVVNAINQIAPDVLFLEERHDEWAGIGADSVDLVAVLGAEYAVAENTLTYATSNGKSETVTNRCPIVYNTNTFRLVASGYQLLTEEATTQASQNKRVITWAVLEDVRDGEHCGERIAVFGTHWSVPSHWSTGASLEHIRVTQATECAEKIAAVLAQYGSMPVLFGGDLNMMFDHETYLNFLSLAGLRDADSTVNGTDNCVRVVDHLSVSGVEITRFEKSATKDCSDHDPIWCDVKRS